MKVILKDTVTHFSITPSSNKSMIIIHLLAADGLLFIELLYIQPTLIHCLSLFLTLQPSLSSLFIPPLSF